MRRDRRSSSQHLEIRQLRPISQAITLSGSCMKLPTWLSKILVTVLSASLVLGLAIGGTWLTRHPMPQVNLMPVAMVVGLASLVYGARNKS